MMVGEQLKTRFKERDRGFTLIEVVIALFCFSIIALATFRMTATGWRATDFSRTKTEASIMVYFGSLKKCGEKWKTIFVIGPASGRAFPIAKQWVAPRINPMPTFAKPRLIPAVLMFNLQPIDGAIAGFGKGFHEDHVFGFFVAGDFGCHVIDQVLGR